MNLRVLAPRSELVRYDSVACIYNIKGTYGENQSGCVLLGGRNKTTMY
jgi:hypothetical protein